jgi:hypothetical protein
MKINQIASLLNSINSEMTGEVAIDTVNEDLSNIVDVGTQLTQGQVDITNFFESYGRKLIDKVGRVVVVDRTYKSSAPDIQRDSWEYGSVMEKIRVSVNELANDTTWSLNRGDKPDQFEYQPATLSAKYFDDYDVFMTQISLPEKLLQSAFKSPADMGKLIAAIENRVQMKLAISRDNLIRRTINNLIAEKIKANKDINLLAMYNTQAGTSLTPNAAIVNPTFLKFAVAQIMKYKKMLPEPSTLFGDDGYVNMTPEEYQKMILLDMFKQNCEVYMESGTFHNELVSLGDNFQTVPYWQGSGTNTNFNFNVLSGINVKCASDGTTTVATSGVIGVIFDRDACAVCMEDVQTTGIYAPKGRFYNYFHYTNARYMNDLAENVVVFTMRTTQQTQNSISSGDRSLKLDVTDEETVSTKKSKTKSEE